MKPRVVHEARKGLQAKYRLHRGIRIEGFLPWPESGLNSGRVNQD